MGTANGKDREKSRRKIIISPGMRYIQIVYKPFLDLFYIYLNVQPFSTPKYGSIVKIINEISNIVFTFLVINGKILKESIPY